jgi:hypothetical protein
MHADHCPNIRDLILSTLLSGQDRDINLEELGRICRDSINYGWINLARSALALLIIKLECEDSRETLVEEISQAYNDARSGMESTFSQLWQRPIESYSAREFEELIASLLVYDHVQLAYALAFGADISTYDCKIACIVATGRWQELTSLLGQPIAAPNADVSNVLSIGNLLLLAADQYPLPESIATNKQTYSLISLIPREVPFVHAILVPRSLVIPANARNNLDNFYDYSYPAMDIPSLLWEQNLPEPSCWLKSISESKEILSSLDRTTPDSTGSWDEWSQFTKPPKNILVRLGLANLLDYLWLHQPCETDRQNNQVQVISDFSPSLIVNQIFTHAVESNSKSDAIPHENLAFFASDIAFMLRFMDNRTVVDISPLNMLHFSGFMKMPAPVKILIIDFDADILFKLVQASFTSNYPEPLPFVFDDQILLKICHEWSDLNNMLKAVLPSRLLMLDVATFGESRDANDIRDKATIGVKDIGGNECITLPVRSSLLSSIRTILDCPVAAL